MDKIINFRTVVKANRQKLIENGFNESTVNSWTYSSKIPNLENAAKLSMVLGLRMSEIPYYRTERVV